MSGGMAATSLDRPAFDFDAKAPPAATPQWSGAGAAPLAPAVRAAAPRPGPPAAGLPPGEVPKSDLGLYIGLGVVAVLIVLILVGIAAGVMMSMEEEPEATESSETYDE
jgi:hypothetical protein